MSGVSPWLLAAYGLAATVAVLLPVPRARWPAGAGVALLGLAVTAQGVGGAGDGTFTAINTALGLFGGALVLLALSRREAVPAADNAAVRTGAPSAGPILPVAVLLCLFAPHLMLFAVGAALALLSAARSAIRARQLPGLVLLALATLLIGAIVTMTTVILGPLGADMNRLAAGPFSPPAERLLVMLAGAFALLVAGLGPLPAVAWGRSLAPVAGLLLLRVAAPAWPLGMSEWRALGAMLFVLLFGIEAIRGRWIPVVIAGGLLAMWTAPAQAGTAAFVLVAGGCVAESGGELLARRGIRLAGRWSGLPALPAALAALAALQGMLRTEVTISLVGLVVLVAGLLRQYRRPSLATL